MKDYYNVLSNTMEQTTDLRWLIEGLTQRACDAGYRAGFRDGRDPTKIDELHIEVIDRLRHPKWIGQEQALLQALDNLPHND